MDSFLVLFLFFVFFKEGSLKKKKPNNPLSSAGSGLLLCYSKAKGVPVG